MTKGYQIIIAAIWDIPPNICSNCRLYTLTDISHPPTLHVFTYIALK